MLTLTKPVRIKTTSLCLVPWTQIVLLTTGGTDNTPIATGLGWTPAHQTSDTIGTLSRVWWGSSALRRAVATGPPPCRRNDAPDQVIRPNCRLRSVRARANWPPARCERHDDNADLTRRRSQAAASQEVQGLARPQVRLETQRHCSSVHEPARARTWAVLQREESGSETRDCTSPGLSTKKSCAEDPNARPHAPRRHGPASSPERSGWPGHRLLPRSPPSHGVDEVPASLGAGKACEQRPTPNLRQRRHVRPSQRDRLRRKALTFYVHFTPTSTSCLKTVECFFRGLTTDESRCGVLHGVLELVTNDNDYAAHSP